MCNNNLGSHFLLWEVFNSSRYTLHVEKMLSEFEKTIVQMFLVCGQ